MTPSLVRKEIIAFLVIEAMTFYWAVREMTHSTAVETAISFKVAKETIFSLATSTATF
jgi:hypothetical protein